MVTFAAAAISGVACFGLGVVFGKYVVSEAAAIKAHVTAEVEKVRADVSAALAAAAKKL